MAGSYADHGLRMGGYLAGRLRTKWTDLHTDEVFFRDTAHGFLVWAVGLVITASLLATAAASLAGGSAQRSANETTVGGTASEEMVNPNAYFVDSLLRSGNAAQDRNDVAARGEAERIFAHALSHGTISPSDSSYLAQLISARTGLNQARSASPMCLKKAQQSSDRARKALAHLSLWLFVALLSGAFCASYAGTIGGKQRDHVRI
jgi:hypothetical protein